MATVTPPIKNELLDQLLQGRDPKTVFESEGLLDELKKALAERMLNAEMDHHLEQDHELYLQHRKCNPQIRPNNHNRCAKAYVRCFF